MFMNLSFYGKAYNIRLNRLKGLVDYLTISGALPLILYFKRDVV